MKYRILQINDRFYPQYRFILWFCFRDKFNDIVSFYWHYEAKSFLDNKTQKENSLKIKVHPYP